MNRFYKLMPLLLGAALLLSACASHRQDDYRLPEQSEPGVGSGAAPTLAERFSPLPTPEAYAGMGQVRSAPPPEEKPADEEPASSAAAPVQSEPAPSTGVPAAGAAAPSEPDTPSQAEPPKEEPGAGNSVSGEPQVRLKDSSSDASSEEAGSSLESASYNLNSAHFLSGDEQEVIDIINNERLKAGLNELMVDESLSKAARIRSYELVKNDMFDHVRPDGRAWNTVLTEDVPTDFRIRGENLATAYYTGYDKVVHQTPQQWYDQWEASPGHYENMMRDSYDFIGVGIYYTYHDGDYTAVATTLFGAY